MASLTPEKVAQLAAWFQTAELPPAPFRTAPWLEVTDPEPWRAIILRDLRFGPQGLYWQVSLTAVRWLAKRIAPAEVQAAAQVGELQGRAF